MHHLRDREEDTEDYDAALQYYNDLPEGEAEAAVLERVHSPSHLRHVVSTSSSEALGLNFKRFLEHEIPTTSFLFAEIKKTRTASTTDNSGSGSPTALYHESLLEMIENFKVGKESRSRSATHSSNKSGGSGYSFLDQYQASEDSDSGLVQQKRTALQPARLEEDKNTKFTVATNNAAFTNTWNLSDTHSKSSDDDYPDDDADHTDNEDESYGLVDGPEQDKSAQIEVEEIVGMEHQLNEVALEEPEMLNPFIPRTLNRKEKGTSAEAASLLPPLASQPNIQDSAHKQLIVDACRKQREALLMFRHFASGSMSGVPISQNYEDITSKIPKRRMDASGVRIHQQLPRHSPPRQQSPYSTSSVGSSSRSNSPAESQPVDAMRNTTEARHERLTSLGIFEVNPRAKSKASAIDAARIPVSSFTTPQHNRAAPLTRDITEVSAPKLVSTSSKMMTVPLTEIWADLKAAGKQIDQTGAERLHRS